MMFVDISRTVEFMDDQIVYNKKYADVGLKSFEKTWCRWNHVLDTEKFISLFEGIYDKQLSRYSTEKTNPGSTLGSYIHKRYMDTITQEHSVNMKPAKPSQDEPLPRDNNL